jgi:hypothetical protein
MICSGAQAVIFEVTPQGEIVWRYKHPGSEFDLGRPGALVPGFLASMLKLGKPQREQIDKLQAQVDEKLKALLSQGQREKFAQPTGGMAFPGGPGGGRGPGAFMGIPRIGEIVPESIKADLKLTETQSSVLKELQDYAASELKKVWTDQQKTQLEQIENMFAGGPPQGRGAGLGNAGGAGPGGLGPPPGGRGGLGPPGAPGGAPGGMFRAYRYAKDYPGLAGRELKPGQKLEDIAAP